jgi:ABC-2 type transport system ATP-binding protein
VDEFAVEMRELTKTFPGGVVAVDGVDLTIPRGTVYGLIGRNGAGKTTTLRLLSGILHPDSGEALVLGKSLWTAEPDHRARVAYVSQLQKIHQWMTLEEICHYLSHFYPKWDQAHAVQLTDHFDLNWDRPVGWMSGGEQQKARLLLALAARPEVLLLDEPAGGLDPIARRDLIERLMDVLARGDGATVILSTHLMDDLERIAEHIGIMEDGRIVQSGRLDELRSRAKRVQIIFEGTEPPADLSIPGVLRSSAAGPVVTAIVELENDADLDVVRRIPGVRVNVFPLGLEDFYVEMFGQAEE